MPASFAPPSPAAARAAAPGRPDAPATRGARDTPSRPSRAPLVSLVVPTYNERDNVVPLLDQVRAVLAHRAFEVWGRGR
jgi:hypothetical protein